MNSNLNHKCSCELAWDYGTGEVERGGYIYLVSMDDRFRVCTRKNMS